MNAIAALFAGGLTVAGNVENFFNKGEKAAGFRESRDLLLNRYREYCFKWLFYVEAYGKTGKACMNAGRLYRQLVGSDSSGARCWRSWRQGGRLNKSMPEKKPLTDYGQDVPRTTNVSILLRGMTKPDEADDKGDSVDLKKPEIPRIIGRAIPTW